LSLILKPEEINSIAHERSLVNLLVEIKFFLISSTTSTLESLIFPK